MTVAFLQKQEWFCWHSHGAPGLVSSYPWLLFAPRLPFSCEAPGVAQHGLPGAAGADRRAGTRSSAGWGSIEWLLSRDPVPKGALWVRPGTAGSLEPRIWVLPSVASGAQLPHCPGRPSGSSGKGSVGSAWTAVPPWRWVGCLAARLPAEPAWVFLLDI